MPNLVGIGLSQVPTNSMLGGLAYQDPEHASINDLDLRNLSQIKALTYDTAVDVFVYDTRKDSDGGAWRKKTQNTSWYNETLGTATRGSRKEFPAVAVIVAESNPNRITIYDGDDPDLSMWMVFKASTSATSNFLAVVTQPLSSVAMLNGELCIGFPSVNGWGVSRVSFLEDSQKWYWTSAAVYYQKANSVAERNVESGYQAGATFDGLLNARVNDVAMTVLPNTPINPSTGLPSPTLAVGTFGGVHIIKHDDSSLETATSTAKIIKVNFTDDNGLNAVITNSAGANQACVYVNKLDTLNGLSYATYANWDGVLYQYDYNTKVLTHKALSINDVITDFVDLKNRSSAVGVQGEGRGLTLVEKSPKDEFNPGGGVVAFVASDYNTGWMHGDIKGAFMSDTDTTDATAGSNLIPASSADFSSSTGWNLGTGWTISGGKLNKTTNDNNTVYYTATGLTPGKAYTFSIDVDTVGSGTIYFYALGEYTIWPSLTTTGTHKLTVVVNATSLNIGITGISGNGCVLDNASLTVGEADRAANGKGLQVYGTITKSAVATGADLVAYSGWNISGGNYMEQHFNSDLDFGTGDYYISVWVRQTYNQSSHSQNYVFHRVARSGGSTSGARFELRVPTNLGNFRFYQNDGSNVSYSDSSGNSFPSALWTHVVCGRRDRNLPIYINGRYDTASLSGDSNVQNSVTNTSAKLFIGGEHQDNNNPWGGDMALFRIGSGFPSPEQIKKMYEDEKLLFQENAKAILHGSSDSITALAFDDTTNLLHVGTSAGRSEFQGLRRINNTTDAVTTAISASNGLVAEQ